MSKRKLENDVEAAEQPIAKKPKEELDANGAVRAKFRDNLFETDEANRNIAAYSESAP